MNGKWISTYCVNYMDIPRVQRRASQSAARSWHTVRTHVCNSESQKAGPEDALLGSGVVWNGISDSTKDERRDEAKQKITL